MVNPFWFWRGFKGKSVTFAALFASLLLGASIAGGFQHLLSALGVHWLYVILIPIFLFSWLDKKEPQWLPDEGQRKLYARGLIIGSILLAILIAWLRPEPKKRDGAATGDAGAAPLSQAVMPSAGIGQSKVAAKAR